MGTSWDGEVEDYKVEIVHGFDFGDVSDFNSQSPPDYSTILFPVGDPDPGPQHIITGLYLGEKIDHEPDGVPHIRALGDDLLDGNDDEDGVVFLDPLVPGSLARVQVTSSLPGTLNAWFDFTRDGDWDDPGEHPLIDVATTGGGVGDVFTIVVPNYAVANTLTFVGFRLSTYTFNGNSLARMASCPLSAPRRRSFPMAKWKIIKSCSATVTIGAMRPTACSRPAIPRSPHNGRVP